MDLLEGNLFISDFPITKGIVQASKKGDYLITKEDIQRRSGNYEYRLYRSKVDGRSGRNSWNEKWEEISAGVLAIASTALSREIYCGKILAEKDGYLIVKKD